LRRLKPSLAAFVKVMIAVRPCCCVGLSQPLLSCTTAQRATGQKGYRGTGHKGTSATGYKGTRATGKRQQGKRGKRSIRIPTAGYFPIKDGYEHTGTR